jgi:DNA invertase Pin-like site-specific DNA recombinase
MNIGYARVSTTGQDYQTQLAKLQAAGCVEIFSEKQSGKDTDHREQLQAAIRFARKGDVLVVTKLDRLARSISDLWKIASELQAKDAGFRVLDQEGMDTSSATGKLLFNILGSIAEFERDLINARTAEGRIAAKERGVKFGRKAKLTDEQVGEIKADVKAGQLSMQAIADKYGIARNSVYRLAGAKDAT